MGVTPSSPYKPSEEDDGSLSIVWYDPLVNKKNENIQLQRHLRSLVNCLKTFDDETECENHIRSVPNDDRILFIVTGTIGKVLIPHIHDLRQILSIYIFCMNKNREGWTHPYKKIKGLFVKPQELIGRIQSDCNQYTKSDEPFFFTIQQKVTNQLNGDFIHSQIFLDILLRIKPTQTDKDKFISHCNETYKDNDTGLAAIEDFSKKYTSDQALHYYTKESFLYRMLNKALQIQNIDLLYLLRFFIIDIQQQLYNNRYTLPLKLYRSQKMTKNQIELLKNSINQFISNNSFLSTVMDRDIALSLLNNENNEYETVIFEIDLNPNVTLQSFAEITQFSNLNKGREFLIMIGSLFRINKVLNDGDRIWTIRLELSPDDSHELQSIFKAMRNEYEIGEKNLLSFANFLADIGKYDHAKTYYKRFLENLSKDDPDIAVCYHGLGNIADDKGDYRSSHRYHQKALELRQINFKSDHPYIASSHNSIGCAYFNQRNYIEALKSYNQAYEILKTIFEENHPDVAMCLNNIACTYERQSNYSDAFEYHEKALKIRQEFLSEYHPHIAQSHHNIANIYRYLNQFDLALKHYNECLRIQKKSLPSQHRDIALTLENIANIYKDMGRFSDALSYYKQADDIYCSSLSHTHPDVVRIEECIRHVS